MSSSHDSARSKSTENSIPEDAPLAIPTPPLRKAWTFGDSNALVEGQAEESGLVSLSWILVPALIAAGVVYLFMPG